MPKIFSRITASCGRKFGTHLKDELPAPEDGACGLLLRNHPFVTCAIAHNSVFSFKCYVLNSTRISCREYLDWYQAATSNIEQTKAFIFVSSVLLFPNFYDAINESIHGFIASFLFLILSTNQESCDDRVKKLKHCGHLQTQCFWVCHHERERLLKCNVAFLHTIAPR